MSENQFTNLIQINAESIGIKSLDNEIINFLNVELEEKIRMVLMQAKKFMRVSKRKTLKVDDLIHSLSYYNFKPIFGYDSYSNAEYEMTESVKGLWRPKQYIIDIEDYLTKPIVSCPMEVFPHFHWIAIEGKRPLIPENFIREEYKVSSLPQCEEGAEGVEIVKNDEFRVDLNEIKSQTTISMYNQLNQNSSIQKPTISNNNNPQTDSQYVNLRATNLEKKSNIKTGQSIEVVGSVIHNISKELQIFFENFQDRFRKEIKKSLISDTSLTISTKEFSLSLSVIEREPGVVELLPYIIEFLMSYLGNQQYIKDPKINMISLYCVDSIIKNPYFYLEPYAHQIINFVLSILLMDVKVDEIDYVVLVKDFAVELLNKLSKKFSVKYPKFTYYMLGLIEDLIIPKSGRLLTSYGAIKCINNLGPSYIISFILPKLNSILPILELKNLVKPISQSGVNQAQTGQKKVDKENQINKESKESKETSEFKNTFLLSKESSFVYKALRESAYITLSYLATLHTNEHKDIQKNLIGIFGEDILPKFLTKVNEDLSNFV